MSENNPTPQQWFRLMDIVGADYEMRTNQFIKGPNGPERLYNKWEELAKEINELGRVQKNGQEWKMAFGKLKGRARKAYNTQMGYMINKFSGGGVTADLAGLKLSAVHERALGLIDKVSLKGNEEVATPLAIAQERKNSGNASSRNTSQTKRGMSPPRQPTMSQGIGKYERSSLQDYRRMASPALRMPSRNAGYNVTSQGSRRVTVPPQRMPPINAYERSPSQDTRRTPTSPQQQSPMYTQNYGRDKSEVALRSPGWHDRMRSPSCQYSLGTRNRHFSSEGIYGRMELSPASHVSPSHLLLNGPLTTTSPRDAAFRSGFGGERSYVSARKQLRLDEPYEKKSSGAGDKEATEQLPRDSADILRQLNTTVSTFTSAVNLFDNLKEALERNTAAVNQLRTTLEQQLPESVEIPE